MGMIVGLLLLGITGDKALPLDVYNAIKVRIVSGSVNRSGR
jgi:hypothetical protein